MAFILDDYMCPECERVVEGWRDEPVPVCCKPMDRLPGGVKCHEERGAIFDPTLPGMNGPGAEFSSRSEMRSHMKRLGMQEVGDKVGGARNEDHMRLGKLFSYKGAPSKRSELF